MHTVSIPLVATLTLSAAWQPDRTAEEVLTSLREGVEALAKCDLDSEARLRTADAVTVTPAGAVSIFKERLASGRPVARLSRHTSATPLYAYTEATRRSSSVGSPFTRSKAAQHLKLVLPPFT